MGSSYTTLEIRLNNVLARSPYFLRDPSSGHLSLSILDNTPLKRAIYNLKPLVSIPLTCTYTYYYVYTTAYPYSQFSDTFFVNPNTTSLELFRPLNNAREQDWYEIFVHVTDTPALTDKFYLASNNNTALLFFTINIVSSIVYIPRFIDVTEYMCNTFYFKLHDLKRLLIKKKNLTIIFSCGRARANRASDRLREK